MSDIILKFWPKVEITESKVNTLENVLKGKNITSDETDFFGEFGYTTGVDFNEYFEPNLGKIMNTYSL